jgi:hypothetical protein
VTTDGIERFKVSYQISPIILTNGIAGDLPDALIPIISLTQAEGYRDGLLEGTIDAGRLDEYFAQFVPIPGGSAIENEIGNYPFANQSVAANAVIVQPLRISMLMICPVRRPGGYQAKFATFSNLQAQLARHSILGGTYTVATPSMMYTDCLLLGLRDVSTPEGRQPQEKWQFDFIQPLLTLRQAEQALNSLMGKIENQVRVTGDPPSYSGPPPAVGDPASGVGPSIIPAARNLVGASAGGSR